ncbi:EI24 domain-containing protein [Donghicola mangrovi]|uniref:CysZ-like protein n=1 Tax=Donghicola mangrovi TaxID=2729614 RepID=A0A850Q5C9_9RHOB|nr:EI24 domain-containing protein [Donghicola mangrovi]NVO24153.1 hypothetical protein [Donghicola mangrovi]
MTQILKALSLSLAQLSDPRFRSVLLKGIGLAIALLAGIYAIVMWIVGWLLGDSVTLPFIGEVTWVDNVVSWGSIPLMLLLSTFLMVPVASAMTGIFLDDVADAVEDQHYAGLPPAQHVRLATNIGDSLRFMGVIVVANLLALVLYLIFAPFAPLIFWALNGFLLSREYFQMVAVRRTDRAGMKKMRRKNALSLWLAGGLMALPLSIPLLNLLVPVVGCAVFTHLYHRLPR